MLLREPTLLQEPLPFSSPCPLFKAPAARMP